MKWRVFAECVVDPRSVIVGSELKERPTQVCLSEHDQVVNAFPPDRANQSLRKTILPGRTGRDWLVANSHRAKAAANNSTVSGVTVTDQVPWGLVPRESLA